MGKWKGVRLDVNKKPNGPVELYDMEMDLGEENNIASRHPEIVQKMEQIMKTARIPNETFKFQYEKEQKT